MAKRAAATPTPTATAPLEVYAAQRNAIQSRVDRLGVPLTDAQAIARLQAGFDIVVCGGPSKQARKDKAQQLMNAAYPGWAQHHNPHRGAYSLPHWHPPLFQPPELHAFYDGQHQHAYQP